MDSDRFDSFARVAATHSSRRSAVKALAGGVLGVLVGRLRPGGPAQAASSCLAPRKPCRRDAACCSGRCDRQRGRCRGCPSGERFCPLAGALQGVCLPQDQCCPGEKACNGQCIPVEQCCGGCPTGQTCCPSPRIGVCADLQNDLANCGQCGLLCPTVGHTCVAGRCVPR